jgi:tetratricopeptide (TPR) repeat protein
MNLLRFSTLLFILFSCKTQLSAQTLDQGKKYLYNERYNSAKQVFEKIVATDAKNDEAIYWLGQSMIRPDDVSAKAISETKQMYQASLNSTNSTLIMAGIGHVELLEGKIQDARNHFEASISLSQGKNIAVLNAIGYANGNPDAKNGDPNYAIEKLKQATQIKKFNDPDVLVNLGDAYRKAGDGGNAVTNYKAALQINPSYARAYYRIGKLYQSQGRAQESIFMEFYNDAINADPTFAPVYANLFTYYYETNVNKAVEYFDKWLANSDEDFRTCYYKAALKYAQGFFLEAISKSNECIASQGVQAYPSLFGLKANAYNKLKDSVKVVENYQEYFKRQIPEKITTADYAEYIKNLFKIPGNEIQAGLVVDNIVLSDSMENNKVNYLKIAAQYYETKKNFIEAANWYNKVVGVKKTPTKYDFNTVGLNYYKGGAYQQSINAFTLSASIYPDDPYTYNMIGKSSWAIDSTMEKGMANAAFEKTIQLSMADTIKYKPQLMTSYKYFVAYYANVLKDKNTAMQYVEKALSLDPGDSDANTFKQALLSSKQSTTTPKNPSKKP